MYEKLDLHQERQRLSYARILVESSATSDDIGGKLRCPFNQRTHESHGPAGGQIAYRLKFVVKGFKRLLVLPVEIRHIVVSEAPDSKVSDRVINFDQYEHK